MLKVKGSIPFVSIFLPRFSWCNRFCESLFLAHFQTFAHYFVAKVSCRTMEDDRTDEDRIIEALVVEGKQALYEDIDFLPLRQSLYNVENVVPEYDDEISQSIE